MNTTARVLVEAAEKSGAPVAAPSPLQDMLAATRSFATEDIRKSWIAVLVVLACDALAIRLTLADWPLGIRIFASVAFALLMVRTFVIFHDYEHGAILRNSRAADVLMTLVGMTFLRSPAEWRRSHNFHHSNNAKLATSSVGSFPTKTTAEWAGMTPKQKLGYKIVRSPWVIVFAYVTCFLLEGLKKIFSRDWTLRLQALFAVSLHVALLGVAARAGASTLLLSVVVPYSIACALGAYLFYVQHNFVGVGFKSEEEWTYDYAALKSSSCLSCGPIVHWFTANIGYHHIHHLNHKIPFYRLPEAMKAHAFLREPVFVKLTLNDIRASLRLKLWDAEKREMVGFREVPS